MKSEFRSITQRQFVFLILQSQIGVGILSLPHDVQAYAKGDGWISTLLAGIAVQLLFWVMWLLGRKYPDLTLFEITKKVLGNWVGWTVNLLYTAYFLLVAGLSAVLFSELINSWILTNTPRWAILCLFIGTAYLLARENIRIMARFYVLTSIFIILLVLLVLMAYTNVEIRYVFPIGQSGIKNIFLGSQHAIIAMIGFEMILVIYPFVQNNTKGMLQKTIIVNTLVTLLYTFFVFTSLIVFSPEEIPLVSEPILYMLKSFRVTIAGRLDLLFISIWLIPMTTFLVSYLYLASKGAASLTNKKHQSVIPFIVILTFIIAMIPQDELSVQMFSEWVSKGSYLFIAVFPCLLLLFAVIFKEKEEIVKR
ncbi:GerAB/ArcD/ProY family transporter [Ammoniphilus resinae]|uniref:Spore germination protein (Amino acid permease) n=1 Tax=Ammoniphilus resinae TaxID=861532 RepID=A0ABS4GNL6_9BACL|nr:GerAB/ArcD/ProY family transporter [Ammoniphilus resinae]MBP1931858.1 spore germination protein (amino acid permease) [Ammoniphilus resinae]